MKFCVQICLLTLARADLSAPSTDFQNNLDISYTNCIWIICELYTNSYRNSYGSLILTCWSQKSKPSSTANQLPFFVCHGENCEAAKTKTNIIPGQLKEPPLWNGYHWNISMWCNDVYIINQLLGISPGCFWSTIDSDRHKAFHQSHEGRLRSTQRFSLPDILDPNVRIDRKFNTSK